jgi:hypothetical protein
MTFPVFLIISILMILVGVAYMLSGYRVGAGVMTIVIALGIIIYNIKDSGPDPESGKREEVIQRVTIRDTVVRTVVLVAHDTVYLEPEVVEVEEPAGDTVRVTIESDTELDDETIDTLAEEVLSDMDSIDRYNKELTDEYGEARLLGLEE